MARPTASKQQEIQDTIYWCACITAYSGITNDAQIGRILNSVDGKNFGRWKKGLRAPTSTGLQMIVKTARQKGLLPKAGIIRTAQEQRLYLDSNKYAFEEVEARSSALKKLQATNAAAILALREYSNAIKNASYVVVLDSSKLEGDDTPREVIPAEIDSTAKSLETHFFLPIG